MKKYALISAAALTLTACSTAVPGTPTYVTVNARTSTFAPVSTVTPTPVMTTLPPPLHAAEVPVPATVRAGSFCNYVGVSGVSSTGKPMVCKTASDGRLRWQVA